MYKKIILVLVLIFISIPNISFSAPLFTSPCKAQGYIKESKNKTNFKDQYRYYDLKIEITETEINIPSEEDSCNRLKIGDLLEIRAYESEIKEVSQNLKTGQKISFAIKTGLDENGELPHTFLSKDQTELDNYFGIEIIEETKKENGDYKIFLFTILILLLFLIIMIIYIRKIN